MSNFKTRITQLWEEMKDHDYRTTQEDFAGLFGATKNQLKGWLRGSGEPNSELMKTIARVSNVSVDWLVGNTDTRTLDQANPHSYDEKIKKLTPDIRRAIDLIIKSCGQYQSK